VVVVRTALTNLGSRFPHRPDRGLLAHPISGRWPCSSASSRTSQPWHQVQRGLLLDVVVHQLLPREDQALLVRQDALLVLDVRLGVLDRVGALDLNQGDGLAVSVFTNICIGRQLLCFSVLTAVLCCSCRRTCAVL
jgi:hypothetical protein